MITKKEKYDFFKDKKYILFRAVNDKSYPLSKKIDTKNSLDMILAYPNIEFSNIIVFKDIIPLEYLKHKNPFWGDNFYYFDSSIYNQKKDFITKKNVFHYKKISQIFEIYDISCYHEIELNNKKYEYQLINFSIPKDYKFYK